MPPAPQVGIFALGTAAHGYLDLQLDEGVTPEALVCALASWEEPRTTLGGVNLVLGFRPELWRAVASEDIPADVVGFNEPVQGVRRVMPATQRDAVVWLCGAAYDVVFDTARDLIRETAHVGTVVDDTSAWPYRYNRDLTGFIDGTENPSTAEAPSVALVPSGQPGEGGTVLLLQKWLHDQNAWEALSADEQAHVMGRSKADSVELADRPSDSHVAKTDQDVFGKIFRRNMPFGDLTEHGTMFVGFSSEQRRLAEMLESMAGTRDGVPDALTAYTRPVSGAHYFVPSLRALQRFRNL